VYRTNTIQVLLTKSCHFVPDMTMATRALLGTTTTTTSLTLVVSRRMMGTGIFGINNKDPFRAPKNLTRMVAREEKR
jgi:hypothetical protein